MAKSPDAFRTISEVSEALDTPSHVLRFWESKFFQIKPVKRAGGRRYYRPEDIALLAGIKILLHDRGLTIKGVQKTLREQGAAHVAALAAKAQKADPGPARIVQLRPHSDAEEANATPEDLPPTEAPLAPESPDMQFSLFDDDPTIPDDPEDTDNFTGPRALAALCRADKAKLARRGKTLRPLLRRLGEIHPQK